MKSIMKAISDITSLELQLVVGGAVLSKDYGDFESRILADGFTIEDRLPYIQGETSPEDVAHSLARCTRQATEVFARLKPDLVLLIADRYEVLSLAQVALCLNIPIAHLEGGEISGSIDERIRHAVTKLSHIHLTANKAAAARIIKMGEHPEHVHVVGSPSLDLLQEIDLTNTSNVHAILETQGIGPAIDLSKDYIVVSQHPVVTEYATAQKDFCATVDAVMELNIPVVWILPNDDAGADKIYAPLRQLQNTPGRPPVCTIGGLPFNEYACLLMNSRVLIGNSSSGVREAGFLGVPVVNVGTRQNQRQRCHNVIDVSCNTVRIVEMAKAQILHGPYACDTLYGDGNADKKITEILTMPLPEIDKTIAY